LIYFVGVPPVAEKVAACEVGECVAVLYSIDIGEGKKVEVYAAFE
jgi:hypothetical protein